jgi:predicted RNA binding protein YcfA (HicA-like mRNA interferase family)
MTRRQRDLERLAREHGWTVERCRGSKHWRLRHPSGAVVVASSSPRDAGNLRVVEAA